MAIDLTAIDLMSIDLMVIDLPILPPRNNVNPWFQFHQQFLNVIFAQLDLIVSQISTAFKAQFHQRAKTPLRKLYVNIIFLNVEIFTRNTLENPIQLILLLS